jgi:hypothetical protein
VNRVRAGTAIPVKFSWSGDYSLAILLTGYPASQPTACGLNQPTEAIEEAVGVGKSGLSYDADTGQYVDVWKTVRQ